MITAKETVDLQKESMRQKVEEMIKDYAQSGYSLIALSDETVPRWLQKELEEAGFAISDSGVSVYISWEVEG